MGVPAWQALIQMGMVNKKIKILITGGAGYIGSHTIIDILEHTPWQVISADNFSNSSPDVFRRIKKITGKTVRNYQVDLCNKTRVENIFKENRDISGIIHFAAFKSVPESVEQPLLYYHNNIESLINLLYCSKKYGIPYFIFSSSCSVYGNISRLPVNEKTPIGHAESPYGFTKQIGERILSDFSTVNSEINTVALRYFNPVGAHPSGMNGEVPTQKPNSLVPMITQTAAGRQKQLIVYGDNYRTRDGTCIRDYIHVSDIAAAHRNALTYLMKTKGPPPYSVFNLGSGRGVTVMEMIKAFEKVSGKKLNYKTGRRREGDVEAIYSDSSLAKKLLHWVPQYNLDDMMRTAWIWEKARTA
jgi:UDP-glucose 4-epimerase